MKILVADDDSDQVMLRCLLLEKSGFDTVQASDPASALALAGSEKPECAVIDLRFPDEESGLRLVRDLKALDATMRLLVLTGIAPARFASRPEAKLVDEFVEKSTGSANLIRKIRAAYRASI
jgi:ActR/RegA family two-component response regulator